MICGAVYFVIVDPYNLRPVVELLWNAHTTTPKATTNVMNPDGGLTDNEMTSGSASATASPQTGAGTQSAATQAQVDALQSVGIDPAFITQITPEKKRCFVRILGQSRVTEVMKGAVPTTSEFFRVAECL